MRERSRIVKSYLYEQMFVWYTLLMPAIDIPGFGGPYDARSIANSFLAIAKKSHAQLTPMKLQKLVYYAHGWSLGLGGRPLIDEPVEAWKWGPVVPSVYHEFKKYGADPITEPATDFLGKEIPEVPRQDEYTTSLLERIWEVYCGFTPSQLSNMTHDSDGPWQATVNRVGAGVPGVPINNDLIAEYFASKITTREPEPATQS
jgi:uncharacterized phage-associated protein